MVKIVVLEFNYTFKKFARTMVKIGLLEFDSILKMSAETVFKGFNWIIFTLGMFKIVINSSFN